MIAMKKMLLLVSIVALLLTACAPAEVPLSGERAGAPSVPAVEPTPQEVPEVIEASVDEATAIDADLAELDALDAELAALENLI